MLRCKGPLTELGELKLCAHLSVLGPPGFVPGGPLTELSESKLCAYFSVLGSQGRTGGPLSELVELKLCVHLSMRFKDHFLSGLLVIATS